MITKRQLLYAYYITAAQYALTTGEEYPCTFRELIDKLMGSLESKEAGTLSAETSKGTQ